MLSMAKIPVVILEYSTSSSQIIQSITSNSASLVGPLTISALTPNYLPSLATTSGISVPSLPNAPKFLFLTGMMDTLQYPYNIQDFRLAIVHAINYSEILSSVGSGYTESYVGPMAPGYPYYNPGNLTNYSYDQNLAINDLTQAGFKVSLPNGTTVNPTGNPLPTNLSITYVTSDPAETKIAQEMLATLASIGVTYTLNGVTTQAEENDISQSGTAATYPGLLIWYWYPSWADAVYQDLVLLSNVEYGGISGDVSWFNDTQVNNLTANLPFETNSTQINATVAQVYNLMYQQAPDIWLYAVDPVLDTEELRHGSDRQLWNPRVLLPADRILVDPLTFSRRKGSMRRESSRLPLTVIVLAVFPCRSSSRTCNAARTGNRLEVRSCSADPPLWPLRSAVQPPSFGAEANSVLVYGCLGEESTVDTGPYSTTLPRCITAM